MLLICPTAFKGTISAREAALAMADGARAAAPARAVRILPLSDGGNGLLDTMSAARGGRRRSIEVSGPLGEPVRAHYLDQGFDVVVETAEACGLHLVPAARRDPLRASTTGVAELLLAAAGVKGVAGETGGAGAAGAEGAACGAPFAAGRLVVGLGGSATVDAGSGMATALGWRLLDERGAPVPPGGVGLLRLASIRPPERPPRLPPVVTLADVTNPLLGPAGGVAVYAPQKGASAADVEQLERALSRWSEIVSRDLGRRVADLPGAGAAGGLGAAFAAFFGAAPRSGADWVLEATGFDALLAEASVVITGEGAWDGQSSMGKITGEVVARAVAARVPVLLVAGLIDGPLPRGVVGADGGGSRLDAAGLAGLVRARVAALL
jgi:glycerate 2-kinase